MLRMNRVRVNIWGNLVESYNKEKELCSDEVFVVVFTSLLVKEYDGNSLNYIVMCDLNVCLIDIPLLILHIKIGALFLSTSKSSRIYINPEIPEVSVYRER